jgi:hypothetical protein
LTITVPSSQDESLDDELKSYLYAYELENTLKSMNVEDLNVVHLEYVGSDASYLASSNNVNAASASQNSSTFASVAIGIGAALAVVGALIATKKVQQIEDPAHPDEKVDDGSEAQQTTDLTYSNSMDDRSEVSSMSPTNRYCPERVAVVRDSMTKHFVLAEEEEANWQSLGITPASGHELEVFEEAIDEQSV